MAKMGVTNYSKKSGMKVEYLIILKQEDKFCNSSESFKKFISVDDDLTIEESKITLKTNSGKKHESTIKIKTGLIDEKNERFFKIELINNENQDVEIFSNLCRKIKKIVRRINPDNIRINTLWDDIGREYAIKAYPLINEVENLMRKLISQFLLINVGMDWSDTAIHDDLQEKIKGKSKNNSELTDELYSADFIQLSEVLFKKYRNITLSELDNIIIKGRAKGNLDIEQISKILPVSNWERYFSAIIEYDEESLKRKWENLYEYRNDVAHNRFINKSAYDKLKTLHKEIIELLKKTIENLDKIDLKTEQRDEILETYSPSRRLVKAAQELNIGTSTIVEYLTEIGYNIDNRPTAKVSDEMYEVLLEKFSVKPPELRGLKILGKIDIDKKQTQNPK